MPISDQYAVYPEDRMLRLISPMEVRTQSREVVRVGSRKFDELIRSGYRVQNPNNSAAHHRTTTLGMHHMATLVVPGYALANELVGGRGSRSGGNRNPVEEGSIHYTPWAGVIALQKRAREAGHPNLVKVFAEADANYAHRKAKADVERGLIPSRFVIGVFGVTDKPRTSGFAPAKWIEEEADRAMDSWHKDNDAKIDASIRKTEKVKVEFMAKVRQADDNIRTKIMPEVKKLSDAIDKHIEKIESKGPDSPEAKKAGEAVKTVETKAKEKLGLLTIAARKTKGAGRGFMRGWRGDDITWGPGVRGGRR